MIAVIAEQIFALGIGMFVLGFVIGDKGGRSAERNRRRRRRS